MYWLRHYVLVTLINVTLTCRRCICHGHCNTCDKDTGITCYTDPLLDRSGCHCHNNTKSPANCQSMDNALRPCYERQVRNGHQVTGQLSEHGQCATALLRTTGEKWTRSYQGHTCATSSLRVTVLGVCGWSPGHID